MSLSWGFVLLPSTAVSEHLLCKFNSNSGLGNLWHFSLFRVQTAWSRGVVVLVFLFFGGFGFGF